MRSALSSLAVAVMLSSMLAQSSTATAMPPPSVTSISVKTFPGKEQVAIQGSGALTYTLANRAQPPGLMLRLAGATLDTPREILGRDVVRAVRAVMRNGQVEIDISLRRTAPYNVTYASGRTVLIVSFSAESQAGEAARFTLNFRSADIADVFRTLSDLANVNIVVGTDVQGRVTVRMVDVTFEEALQLILEANRLGALRIGRSVVVMPLDRLPPPSAVARTYRLQHASATDVATLINTLQQQAVPARGTQPGSRGIAIADSATNSVFVVAPLEDHAVIEMLLAGIDLPVPQRVVRLNFLDAKPTAELLKELLGKEGIVFVKEDARSNSLVLAGSDAALARAQSLLKELDIPLPQVMIEARVVELNKGASRELGLSSLVQPTPPATTVPPVGQIIFEIATQNLEAFLRRLQALINEDRGRILASPRIATLDGQQAVITVGSTISVPVVGPQGTVGVQEINAGITLAITPRVNTDGMITARLNPQVRSLSSSTAQGFIITERSAETTLTIRDGMSIVIGGLITIEEIEFMSRIPLLSDIPILGELFKFRRTQQRESEIIIIITPRILTLQAPAP